MAKLTIYRGDALDREIDLSERTLRVGRGDQNDIVLPDPGKSVSRFHAELRFEQGRYTIVDLNSQNGTWIANRRVQQAELEPGVPAILGTYRIVLKAEGPAAEEVEATLLITPPAVASRPAAAAPPPPPPEPPVITSSSSTLVGAAAPRSPEAASKSAPPPAPAAKPATTPDEKAAAVPATAPPPVPEPAKVAPAPPDPPKPPVPPPAPPAPPKATPPAPKPVPAAPPAPKPEPPKPAASPAPAVAAVPPQAATKGTQPSKKGMSKVLMVGAFVVLVLGVMAAAIFLTPLKDRIPGIGGGAPAATTPAAPSAQEPAKPEAAPSQPPAPTETTPPPPAADAPAAKPEATPAVQETPAAKPAPAAQKPAPPASTSARPAAAKPTPAAGEGRRGPAVPPAKPLNLAQTIEAGRAAMIKGDYLGAIAAFEAVLKVDPKYPNANDLLGVARGGAKNASQLAVDTGNKAEMGGDYATAARQYERALQLDPDSTAAPEASRRLKARMQGEGEDAFKRARQYDALGRGKDAIPMYEKAIQLLPADHASVAVAKDRLAALKGGL